MADIDIGLPDLLTYLLKKESDFYTIIKLNFNLTNF